MAINVKRIPVRFSPDPKRVITHFFMPGDEERARQIIKKILDMSDEEHRMILNQTLRDFSRRHRNITRIFENNFNNVRHVLNKTNIDADTLSKEKKLVIGSYFTKEYSIESAAFFNPSIVEDPYQLNLSNGQKRVIVSFRATGEGHISSITFRSGIIDKDNNLVFKTPSELVDVPEIVTRHVYQKALFLRKLDEMRIKKDVIKMVMDQLNEEFVYGELQAAIAKVMKQDLSFTSEKVLHAINWLATSHYEVTFSMDTALSERVLFPVSYTESNGIEDARFVRFTNDGERITYYATYTAYNGFAILPKLIETEDFYHFKVQPINGEYAQNKGMALFPRKIDGQYTMLSRIDGINNYVMFSDEIHLWRHAEKIQEPMYPWELVQVGNAGSPIETDQGWLVITHGVGVMRTYCLGAVLLDLDKPTRLIGRLKEPLLVANEEERAGYVPNVVYSCGSIVHNNELIIPYTMSDYASAFAVVLLDELLHELRPRLSRKRKQKSVGDEHSILLVEDDAVTRETIHQILMKEGYQVEVASDGIDALMHVAQEHFDLIISDIRMPNLDGFQLLEKMNEKKIHIPVILITGYHNHEYQLKSKKLGAVDYIKKPINRKLLIDKLKKLF
ncbi:response regulator [bacterium]|nr:response regulator [bacterium]RQV96329.1 MAG: response regulator [bacterium]